MRLFNLDEVTIWPPALLQSLSSSVICKFLLECFDFQKWKIAFSRHISAENEAEAVSVFIRKIASVLYFLFYCFFDRSSPRNYQGLPQLTEIVKEGEILII